MMPPAAGAAPVAAEPRPAPGVVASTWRAIQPVSAVQVVPALTGTRSRAFGSRTELKIGS